MPAPRGSPARRATCRVTRALGAGRVAEAEASSGAAQVVTGGVRAGHGCLDARGAS
jgi:hypothetical protein